MKISVKSKSEDCGASAASLGAIPTGGSRVRKNEGADIRFYNGTKNANIDYSKYQKDIDTTVSAVNNAIGKKYDNLKKDIPSYWKLPPVQLA